MTASSIVGEAERRPKTAGYLMLVCPPLPRGLNLTGVDFREAQVIGTCFTSVGVAYKLAVKVLKENE